jgi:hypothetical protein
MAGDWLRSFAALRDDNTKREEKSKREQEVKRFARVVAGSRRCWFSLIILRTMRAVR